MTNIVFGRTLLIYTHAIKIAITYHSEDDDSCQ